MISWVPLLAVAILWWTFSAGLPNRMSVGVLNQDHSALSRQLIRFLQATPGLQVLRPYDNSAEITKAMRRAEGGTGCLGWWAVAVGGAPGKIKSDS